MIFLINWIYRNRNLKPCHTSRHLPAGLMGIDKGQKDQSPLLYFYLTIDVGRRVSAWGSGADSEILE